MRTCVQIFTVQFACTKSGLSWRHYTVTNYFHSRNLMIAFVNMTEWFAKPEPRSTIFFLFFQKYVLRIFEKFTWSPEFNLSYTKAAIIIFFIFFKRPHFRFFFLHSLWFYFFMVSKGRKKEKKIFISLFLTSKKTFFAIPDPRISTEHSFLIHAVLLLLRFILRNS